MPGALGGPVKRIKQGATISVRVILSSWPHLGSHRLGGLADRPPAID